MRISDKKRSTQLFRLQLAGIVTGVALIVSLIGLFLYKKNIDNKQIVKTANKSNPELSSSPAPSASPLALTENIDSSELAYNIQNSPNLNQNRKLQRIVDEIVDFTKNKQFPTQPLSITIIDVETGEYAGYQQEKLRYPASVVKLFWMVNLYAQIEKGILLEAEFPIYLDSMIKKSDNEAASYIIDRITNTKYKQNIQGEEYKIWENRRLKINQYFQKAGYDNINLSQKTFPIPSLNLSRPKGSELKLRNNPQKLIRNQISTQQVARLLYEIHTNQSISEKYSSKMANLLTIDSETRNIRRHDKNPNEFNPVRGFLSASLPDNVNFKGKAGWTSGSRNDAAIITTPNGKTYILVVFAQDRAYAYDWQIFPEISQLVFNRMTNK
ncbi:MAG: serine hydrolase [Cyanobacteria bacterium P01_A01_bin.80]